MAVLLNLPISRRAADQIQAGHLWIFSNEFQNKITQFAPGALCQFSFQGKAVALGYVNPHSLIAGRVLSLDNSLDLDQILRSSLRSAFERRLPLKPLGSCRLVFSEADFLPGLILDSYSGVLVLQSNTAGIDQLLLQFKNLIPILYKEVFGEVATGFVVRADGSIRTLEGLTDFVEIVLGDAETLKAESFHEADVIYAADFLEGQKTGFFLDQRDNRLALGKLVKLGANVLDLFCYSGGWGLRALKAGAEQVTFVDQSALAIDQVKRGLHLNRFGSDQGALHVMDVFDFLEKDTRLYDIVVADPPAFVKSKKNLPQAQKAYEKLNRLAWKRVKPGGILFSCSCSYHLSEADFWNVLSAAVGKEKGLAHVIYRGGQGADHPVLLSMPETNYLKCVGIKKI